MARNKCPLCYCINVVKNGVRRGRQRYLCQDCQASWTNGTRPKRFQNCLWKEYAFESRTVRQLAKQYDKNPKWIRQQLAAFEPNTPPIRPRAVTIIMDVTYFGSWGMLVVIDPYARTHLDENLVLYYAILNRTERTWDYDVATDTLEAMGYTVQACVIDGRRGVRQMLERKNIPVQQCQFHQLQTMTQCLTKRPKLSQNQELRSIALALTKTTKSEFETKLDVWHEKHGKWLKERSRDPVTGRWRYQHDRTRRAYFSLRRNLQHLFTYQDKELQDQGIKIPNTTNALDGRFGVWKNKLRQHRGCSKTLKTKMLVSFLSGGTD